MNHILDIINKQISSGKAFTQSKFHSVLDRGQFPKFHWDFYPVKQDYYHELNPFFISNLYRKEFLDFTNVITVRDGKIAFANYLLSNSEGFLNSKSHFLIPSDFSDLIPSTLRDKFSCWHLSSSKKKTIKEAKRIYLFGLMTRTYIGKIEKLKTRLEADLKGLSSETEINLILPLRSDPMSSVNHESVFHYEVYECIRKILKDRILNLMTMEQFFDLTIGSHDYLYDLKADNAVVSDSYLHYYFCSRNASVNLMDSKVPEDTIKSLRISFCHQINITPLKFKDNTKFAELIFYKRLNNKNLIQDKNFQKIIFE